MRINNPTRIFVHTTDANYRLPGLKNQFFAVNRWHKQRFGNYCKSSMGYYGGYHTIATGGKEYRYREDWEESCAIGGHNITALHHAIGFDGDIQMPLPKDVEITRKRLVKWCKKYNIPTTEIKFVGPHRLVDRSKTCYGSLLADDWALKLVQRVEKSVHGKEKKTMTEKERKILIDKIRALVLRLRIFLNKRKRERRKKGRA